MTKTWDNIFQPIMDAGTISGLPVYVRPQQARLGQAIIETIESKSNLVAEARTGVGKSAAYLIPAISKFLSDRSTRTVVSTETTALQDQLVDKDLPFLHSVYGNFKFRCLKGRSWYLCINRAKMSAIGNRSLFGLVMQLEKLPRTRLGDGERRDVEKAIGHEIDNDTWSEIAGESGFCADAGCKEDHCWSTRARTLAAAADIVVVNHALLRTDADMQIMSDGEVSLLGKIDVLVVDEAHTLDKVLIDGWTRELKPWDIWEAQGEIDEALGRSAMHVEVGNLGYKVNEAFNELSAMLDSVTKFLSQKAAVSGMQPGQWSRQNFALCEYVISGNPPAELVRAMVDYEGENVGRAQRVIQTLQTAEKKISDGLACAIDEGGGGLRKLRKGVRRCQELAETLRLVSAALPTRNGIVVQGGVPYGVIVDGITMKKRGDSVIIRVVPLDVSSRAERTLWRDKTSILVSATLADPTRAGDMGYVMASLGVPDADTLLVDSPFKFAEQQRIYITDASRPPVPVPGARYSLEELVEIIEASRGRTLALFTARSELDHAVEEIRYLQSQGRFDYDLLVQDKDSNKQKLVEQFKSNRHSVLLGTKSMFTGVDFPGETCSTVVLCKFPLPQYNSLAKQQIEWWRRRSYPAWYEREALLVFSQAIGRLIRSETDHGVVALLDQRLAHPNERVYSTASVGIQATGSRVIQTIDEVREFLK